MLSAKRPLPTLAHPLATVQRIIGVLLMLFSLSMWVPLSLALAYGEGGADTFAQAFIITLLCGLLVWLPVRDSSRDMKIRDGFLIVVLFWFVLSGFGALPLLLAAHPQLSFTDAVFEAVSGLTTTGATILTAIDGLPHAILFWRQLLHWMGGMGIIVLAVAVLPMLGVGGMQMYRAEIPGPVKDAKLTPRIRETAKALWYVYVALTVLGTALLWFAGMSLFDAASHAMSAISTGGFANYDASIGHFDSTAIDLVITVIMLLGGLNFGLHFSVWRNTSPANYMRDPEARTFVFMVVGATIVVAAMLWLYDTLATVPGTMVTALFTVVSIGTTTGLEVTDYSVWPTFVPMLLLMGCFVGGCAGSTTGGMKVMRYILLCKQGLREITLLIHPNAKIPIKLGRQTMSNRIIQAVWGFFAAYVTVFILLFLVLLANGVDELTAFSAVAACLNDMGAGLGEVATHFASLPVLSKWVLSLAMIMGRLEVFTLLVIFSPAFWRR